MDELVNEIFKSELLKGWRRSRWLQTTDGTKMRLWTYEHDKMGRIIMQFRDENDLAISDIIAVPRQFVPFVIKELQTQTDTVESTSLFDDCRSPELFADPNAQKDKLKLTPLGEKVLTELTLIGTSDLYKYRVIYTIAKLCSKRMAAVWTLSEILRSFIESIPNQFLELSQKDIIADYREVCIIHSCLNIQDLISEIEYEIVINREGIAKLKQSVTTDSEDTRRIITERIDDSPNGIMHINDLGNCVLKDLNLISVPSIAKIDALLLLSVEIQNSIESKYSISQIISIFIDAFPSSYKIPDNINSFSFKMRIYDLKKYRNAFDYNSIRKVMDIWKYDIIDALRIMGSCDKIEDILRKNKS